MPPYSCDVTDGGGGLLGSEWMLGFSVHRPSATVVADASQQNQFLRNCSVANCAYVAASKELYTGAELNYGSPYTNNSSHTSTMTVGQKTEISNTTSFGTALSSSVDVGGVWSAGVALTYNDSWTYTSSFSQSEQIELDPGQAGWFTIAPEMLKVTGDFYVQYNGTLIANPSLPGYHAVVAYLPKEKVTVVIYVTLSQEADQDGRRPRCSGRSEVFWRPRMRRSICADGCPHSAVLGGMLSHRYALGRNRSAVTPERKS